jgi:DNA modification methylase
MPDSAIIQGDCREVLAGMAERSVQCVVTSPPYWGLRDYGVDGQLGSEKTPEEFIETMVGVFRAVRRVLRDDGTLWLNMGDSYAGSSSPSQTTTSDSTGLQGGHGGRADGFKPILGSVGKVPGLKPKDLIGMPWRLALALQADGAASLETMTTVQRVRTALLADFDSWDAVPYRTRSVIEGLDREWADAHRGGWYLRSDIIWAKPNPMPESRMDRPTKSHEYLFMLTKRPTYFWDAEAVREKAEYGYCETHGDMFSAIGGTHGHKSVTPGGGGSRNIRTVWTIPTQPFPEAHFATFPEKLVLPCIRAGTSEKGCCPECGAAWVRVVEREFHPQPNVSAEKGRRAHDGQKPMDESSRWGGTCRGSIASRTTGWRPGCECEPRPALGIHDAIDCIVSGKWDMKAIPCTVLDPFAGSGTVGVVCARENRAFIGIELNPEYVKMAEARIGSAMRVADDNRKQGRFDYAS